MDPGPVFELGEALVALVVAAGLLFAVWLTDGRRGSDE